jgi:hypothetical protein
MPWEVAMRKNLIKNLPPTPIFFATAHSKGLSDFCAVILERREARGSTGKGRTARLDGTAKFIAYYNR